MSDLKARIARIREANAEARAYEVPAWVNDAPPQNPRAPTEAEDHVDFYSMWTERDAARTEVAEAHRRIEALTELVTVLHGETGCVPPCRHFALLAELALG